MQEEWQRKASEALERPCPPPGVKEQFPTSAAAPPATPPPAAGSGLATTGAFDFKLLDIKPIANPFNRTLLILGGAGAAGLGILTTVGGEETTGPGTAVTPNPPPAPAPAPAPAPPPPPPPPPQPTADGFNGTYMGNLSVTENGCGFAPSAGFNLVLNVNSAGSGLLQFTYISFGQQQYVFNNVTMRMNGNQGLLDAETTGFGYRFIIQSTFSGNAVTGRISFFDPSRGNCHTGYNLNGTRQ
jgi:hypothetical protein